MLVFTKVSILTVFKEPYLVNLILSLEVPYIKYWIYVVF